MLQQINLLISLETESKTSLSARRFLELSALFCVLLAFIYLATWWRTSDKRNEIAELNKKQNQSQSALEKLKSEKAGDKTESILKDRLNTLTTRRNAKMQVLTVLTDKKVGNIDGFSTYMEGMARERVAGVSIQTFEVSEGGAKIYLAGSASDESLVPKLIQEAGQAKAFKGKTFKEFLINRSNDKNNYVDFKIYTEQTAGVVEVATPSAKSPEKK